MVPLLLLFITGSLHFFFLRFKTSKDVIGLFVTAIAKLHFIILPGLIVFLTSTGELGLAYHHQLIKFFLHGGTIYVLDLFGLSEVADFDSKRLIEENVAWFKVAMCDVLLVQLLKT